MENGWKNTGTQAPISEPYMSRTFPLRFNTHSLEGGLQSTVFSLSVKAFTLCVPLFINKYTYQKQSQGFVITGVSNHRPGGHVGELRAVGLLYVIIFKALRKLQSSIEMHVHE